MKLIITILFIFLASAAGAQKYTSDPVGVDSQGRMIYRFVEELPWAPYNLPKYLARKLQYPDSARNANVEGVVKVGFFIDTRGRIRDVKVTSEDTLGYGLEEEAVRVIRKMPNWIPGKQNGRRVDVPYTLPIRFTLVEEVKKSAEAGK